MNCDLLNPNYEDEKNTHKMKRLVQAPDSYFMDVKCSGCFAISTIFSHAQTPIQCEGFKKYLLIF